VVERSARAGEDEGLDLAALLRLLWRRRWWIAVPPLLALATAGLYLRATPPVYRAEALLAVAPRPVADGDLPAPPPRLDRDSAAVDSLVQLLAAPSLRARAARRAGLPPEAADAIRAVRRGATRVVAVEAEWSEPAAAARLADAVVRLFLADHLARKREAARESVAWLEARIAEVEEKLARAERALAELRDRRVRTPGALVAATPASLAELERRYLLTVAQRRALEAKLAALGEAEEGRTLPGPLVDRSTAYLDRLETLHAELVAREAELSDRYGPRHPRLVELRREKRALEARIARERRALWRRFEAEVRRVGAEERALADELARLRDGLADLRRDEIRERELQREMERLRALHGSYTRRLAEAVGRERLAKPDVELVQAAVVPDRPVWPKPVPLLAFAGASGLGLGLLLLFLREQLDGGYRTASALARDLGGAPVVTVPRLAPRLARELPPADLVVERPRGRFAEAVREATARLLSGLDSGGGVVLVTSALPGEGKSTLALALARTAALEGVATALVDADLIRPSLGRRLELPRGPGFAEVMERDLDPLAVLCDDPLTPLRVMPGSVRRERPGRILAGEATVRIFDRLRARFRLVVVDSPPLAAVADAVSLAAVCDGILFVVRWRDTERTVVRRALQGLGPGAARPVLGVLQQVRELELARYDYAESGRARRGPVAWATG